MTFKTVGNGTREYDRDRDITLPVTDITKTYIITNRTNGPLPITLTNESGNQTHSGVLTRRDVLRIAGNRMTKFIWLLEREGKIKVEVAHD